MQQVGTPHIIFGEFSPPPNATFWTLVLYGFNSSKETKWHQFRTEHSSKETYPHSLCL